MKLLRPVKKYIFITFVFASFCLNYKNWVKFDNRNGVNNKRLYISAIKRLYISNKSRSVAKC